MHYTSRILKNALGKAFANEGISITSDQWAVLMLLWQKEGLAQHQISKLLQKEKTTITRLINTLEDKHYIVRIKNKNDKRTNLIYLTKSGKNIKDRLIDISDITHNQLIDGIDNKDIETTKRVLKMICENTKVQFNIE